MHCPQLLYEGTVLGKPRSHKTITIVVITIYQISGQQFSRILIGSRNSEYPWLFTALQTERKMARCFAKVSEEEIKPAFSYPFDLVNTKTTIPLRVGEERWIYSSMLRVLAPLFTSSLGDSCILLFLLLLQAYSKISKKVVRSIISRIE